MPNLLAGETSPYLLQHANNPVDWQAVGPRRAGASQAARSPHLPLDRLRRLPLVPRHGARIVRGRGDGRVAERTVRVDQGRPRGAARPRLDLHGRGPGDDRQRRLADVGLPDARRPALLRRDVLPGRAAPRHALVPPGAGGRLRGVGDATRRGDRRGSATRHCPRGAGTCRGARRAGGHRCGLLPGRERRPRRQLRHPQRFVGWRAEVPAAHDDRVPAAPSRRG